ncbi:MAG TPA: hypothetical protein P5234_00425 [Thermoanaerobaculaceae bacterium]|nr:hypothetical protein [Thermoanaerobaculaceae bacterium]HRS14692.1 hypothetical protein [Thermoanaerobaculaceae bacterium]
MTRRPTDDELRRRLSTPAVPEPPADLAARIKAEIPGELLAGAPAAAASRSRQHFVPVSLRLMAASLLLGIGVGWVGANFVRPPADLARDIALDGVLTIPFEPVEVLVPPRWQAERHPGRAARDACLACLQEQVRLWRFPAAAGVSVVRLTLFVDPHDRLHRTTVEGALAPAALETPLERGLEAARGCFDARAEARFTVFIEFVVGSDGKVVWVEATAPR